MVLFVKRTFAIKVSSGSRRAQGSGGGGGKMEEKCALGKSWGNLDQFGSLRDAQFVNPWVTHQRPFMFSCPWPRDHLVFRTEGSFKADPGCWASGYLYLSFLGAAAIVEKGDPASHAVLFHVNPSSGRAEARMPKQVELNPYSFGLILPFS